MDIYTPTESQPALLYDLAKLNKKDISLRPVLSLRNLYESLNKIVTKLFDKIERAKIKTNTQENFLDFNNLYTKVPLKEAIGIALGTLYEQEKPPDIARNTIKRLLNLAVLQVHLITMICVIHKMLEWLWMPFLLSYWRNCGLKSSNLY